MELYNACAKSVLGRIESNSIDCIISDIPYSTISGGNRPQKGKPTGVLAKNDGKVFRHNEIKPSEYMPELYRVMKDRAQIWIFTNENNRRAVEDQMILAGFKIHYLGGWVKNNCTPNRWGMKNCEYFFVARKGKARGFYTPSIKQFLFHENPRNKLHETEKPVSLMAEMVAASTRQGETVFDPFMGSGSTGVAAAKLGRRFVGCEIDPEHFDVAAWRLGKNNPTGAK